MYSSNRAIRPVVHRANTQNKAYTHWEKIAHIIIQTNPNDDIYKFRCGPKCQKVCDLNLNVLILMIVFSDNNNNNVVSNPRNLTQPLPWHNLFSEYFFTFMECHLVWIGMHQENHSFFYVTTIVAIWMWITWQLQCALNYTTQLCKKKRDGDDDEAGQWFFSQFALFNVKMKICWATLFCLLLLYCQHPTHAVWSLDQNV